MSRNRRRLDRLNGQITHERETVVVFESAEGTMTANGKPITREDYALLVARSRRGEVRVILFSPASIARREDGEPPA